MKLSLSLTATNSSHPIPASIHQGAIDMAKVVIAFGKDPEIRKLAEEVVKAQETEIAFMREWLRRRGQ